MGGSCAKCEFLCDLLFFLIFRWRIGLFSFSNLTPSSVVSHHVKKIYDSFLFEISCFSFPPLLLFQLHLPFLSVSSVCSILSLLPAVESRKSSLRVHRDHVTPASSLQTFSLRSLQAPTFRVSETAPRFSDCLNMGHPCFPVNTWWISSLSDALCPPTAFSNIEANDTHVSWLLVVSSTGLYLGGLWGSCVS